jgi:molybdopterin synthase catalytic subunit
MMRILVQTSAFDQGAEMASLGQAGVGGIASFTGIVRGGEGLIALTLEHYPGMTEKSLSRLGEAAMARWPLADVTIIHRVGRMLVGEGIVFVGTSSAHRAAALEACAFLIDCLKTNAPFWKNEEFEDGRSEWVDARDCDDVATARWG